MVLQKWSRPVHTPPLSAHETRGAILSEERVRKRSPPINVQLVGSREVFGRPADEITSESELAEH